MRLRERIRFALRNVGVHFWRFVGGIMLLIAFFLLLLVTSLNYVSTRNVRKSYQSVLAAPLERCGFCKLGRYYGEDFLSNEDMTAFRDKVDRLEEVIAAGGYAKYLEEDAGELGSLIRLQEEMGAGEPEYPGYLSEVVIDKSLYRFFSISLLEGSAPADTVYGRDEDLLYLGYDYYGKVELGQEYVIHDKEGYHLTYRVAGFFKEGAVFPEQFIADLPAEGYSISIADYSVDGMAYIVNTSQCHVATEPSDTIYFSVREGVDQDEFHDKLKRIAAEQNLDISVGWLDAVVSAHEGKMKVPQGFLLQLTVMIGVLGLIILTCAQTMMILYNKSMYGILYANGASTSDVVWITIFENVLQMLLALCVAFPVCYLIGRVVLVYDPGDAIAFRQALCHVVAPTAAIGAAVFAILMSAIPVTLISTHAPVEMIGGNQE